MPSYNVKYPQTKGNAICSCLYIINDILYTYCLVTISYVLKPKTFLLLFSKTSTLHPRSPPHHFPRTRGEEAGSRAGLWNLWSTNTCNTDAQMQVSGSCAIWEKSLSYCGMPADNILCETRKGCRVGQCDDITHGVLLHLRLVLPKRA